MPDLLNYLGNCPVCNRRLSANRATVIRETPEGVFVGVECPTCWASLALTIMINDVRFPVSRPKNRKAILESVGMTDANEVVTLVGMVTDLTAADLKKVLKEPALTLDDVLELHQYLKKR